MSVVSSPSCCHPVALLLVDVINDFNFPDGDALLALAGNAAPHIEALLGRAHEIGVPVVYVNDNFGNWRSDFHTTVARCSGLASRAAPLVRLLAPRSEDYFVLKPKHSGFFHTPLQILLQELQTEVIIVCGFATNSCVAFTANDAHMLGYRVIVPRDTTAANTEWIAEAALRQLQATVHAKTCESTALDFARLCGDE